MAGGVGGQTEVPWPELRQELRLYPGPAGANGEPSWTLHDPQAQRFFRLGWQEVEILNRWRLGSPQAVVAAIAAETTLNPTLQAVETLRGFLITNQLVYASARSDVARMVQQKYGKKTSIFSAMLKNYLFIRIPLVRPDHFLERTVGYARVFFSKPTAVILILGALLGFYLISRRWNNFGDTFSSLLSLEGGILAALALAVSKSAHELGHAYASKLLGLKVPSMGVSLMCFAPVMWTDTTEAWKLPRQRDRLFIGAAGVMAEMALAVPAALLWTVLPPGALRTTAFIMAGSTWVLTLVVNINPLMRYDGYYLLSDYWEIPGLQQRSTALSKWSLREWLFGLNFPAPEHFSRWDRTKLVVYAICTWVYRFFLFLGIALMVYYLFFKALGIVLMLVELVVFITLPVGREIMQWVKLRRHFKCNYRLLRSGLIACVLLFLFVYPWHARVGGAGLLYPENHFTFYAPMGGVVEEVAVSNGSHVEKGDLLFRLQSPDLDSRIDLGRKKIARQRLKLSMASLDMALRAEMATDWDELRRLAEDLAGMLEIRGKLAFHAPFAGTVADMPVWFTPGSWVEGKEWLGVLVGGGSMVAAYVSEIDWNRITVDSDGLFYPSGVEGAPIKIRVEMVEGQAVTEITYPELASVMGGPLPAQRDSAGRFVPEHAVYRIFCRVEGEARKGYRTGTAAIEAEPRSLASLVWHNLIGLLVRESDL